MKVTRRQLRKMIQEQVGSGEKAPVRIEQGYFFLDGDMSNQAAKSDGDIIDEHSGPQDMRSFILALTLLKEKGYTEVVDGDTPENSGTIDEYIALVSQPLGDSSKVSRNPGRPPSIALRPSGVESMSAQKMANLDPLVDGFDRDFMKLAKAVIELEYSGYGGIIDALIDLGD